jgi:hydroxyacyl-ACP dehydratase HTD2-like protein with hotdog domain
MRWSPVALFRFSALTFNAHMIHYNDPWTRGIEGHPNVVVHGPLNLINMLDYWGDQHHAGRSLNSITYRATAPVYAGQNYVIGTSEKESLDGGRELSRITITRDGTLCMKGEVTSTAI